MKYRMIFAIACLLCAFAIAPHANAQTASQREQALEQKIQELQSQLEGANKTIAELEDELEAVKGTDASSSVAEHLALDAEATKANQRAAGYVLPATAQFNQAANPIDTAPKMRSFIQAQNSTTPASVTSLGPEEILLGGIEDVSRIQYLVPALRYGQSGHDVRLGMRGARTASIGAEATPAVGMYEDGVYISTSTEGLNSFVDVARVDVLRGPQITNFGQHAYAGAVSIVSNKPNFEGISGYAELENGLPDKTRWRVALNLPVAENWAVRLAGVSETRSGLVDNSYIESDADDLNNRAVQTIRASVLWQPSDSFSLLYWSRYQDENGTGSAPWGYQQVGAYVDGEYRPGNQFAPPGFRPDTSPWAVTRNFISSADYENWVNALDLNWDMGFASLQWLSSYTAFHGRQGYDNDYTNYGEPTSSPFAGWETSQTGWTSELRMTSEPAGAFNWLAGLYFSDRSADWGWLEAYNSEFERAPWDLVDDYSSKTSAAFGQLSYDFNERWSVTGGLRWNEEKKTSRTRESDSWDDLLWKAALEWNFSDRSMTYFSASTGYKAGGINTAPGVATRWDPEKLTAYEIGLKSTLADGRVMMNLAAWYNDFKDVQSQSFMVLPYPGSPEATEYTGNGGTVDAKGIEAEINWAPMAQWKISTQISYTDAKFGNYVAPALSGIGDIPGHTDGDSLSYRGWHPALTPKWVVGLQTSYTFPLGDWGSFTPYLQTQYVSDYYANDANLQGIRQGSQSITDLRFIWLAPGEHFQVQFYYLNGEDKASLNWARVYSPAARPDITTLQGNWSNPNVYGVIFNYTF